MGLASAFCWATTGLAIKAQSDRIDTSSYNAFRLVVGALFFIVLLPFFGGWDTLAQISTPSKLALAGSGIVGVAIGDTLYFWSMTKIGAARALPLSSIYPLFTWVIAIPLLGEQITLNAMIGTALVLGGVYLLSPQSQATTHHDARMERLGTLGAIVAAALWAISTTLMKIGLQDGVNLVAINVFRMPIAALGVLLIVMKQKGRAAWQGYNLKSLPVLIVLGIYSTGIGGILWTLAIDYGGAARAALLNSASPLIGVPLSVLFLKERMTPTAVVGALLSVFGVWLIL